MNNKENSIGIHLIAKAPIAGWCKTRLGKTIGDQSAAQFQHALLQDHLHLLKKLHLPFHLWLGQPNKTTDVGFDFPAEQTTVTEQMDLKTLLQHAHHTGKEKFKWKHCLFIGVDSLLAIDQNLSTAFAHTERNQVVLGPCEDGGIYLMGIPDAWNINLETIAWETDQVFSQLRTAIPKNSIDSIVLQISRDIDHFEDLLWFKENHHALSTQEYSCIPLLLKI